MVHGVADPSGRVAIDVQLLGVLTPNPFAHKFQKVMQT
jgi:hypothetical protein